MNINHLKTLYNVLSARTWRPIELEKTDRASIAKLLIIILARRRLAFQVDVYLPPSAGILLSGGL